MSGTTQCFEAIDRAATELGLLPADYARCDSRIEEEGVLNVSFYDLANTLLGTIEVPLEESTE